MRGKTCARVLIESLQKFLNLLPLAIADLGFKGYSHIHGTIGVQTKITFEIRLEKILGN